MWSTPKIQGTAPKPRSYHTAVAIGETYKRYDKENEDGDNKSSNVSITSRIVIFGGNNADRCFNTVHVLEKIDDNSSTTWRWINPTITGKPPSPRTGQSATVLSDQKTICIYGGWDPMEDDEVNNNANNKNEGDEIFGDSFLLDTEKWSWRLGPKPAAAGHALDPSHGPDGGARRTGHTAVLNNSDDDDQVLVFGGRLPDYSFTDDFQTLNMKDDEGQ